MAETNTVQKFDQGMAELQAIVSRLESGGLPLEEALAGFEAGIALVRTLNHRLTEAESRIEVLTRDSAGALHLQAVASEPAAKS